MHENRLKNFGKVQENLFSNLGKMRKSSRVFSQKVVEKTDKMSENRLEKRTGFAWQNGKVAGKSVI